MTSARRRLAAAVCAAAIVLAAAGPARAGRYHPRLKFRTLRTAHFTIYFHQEEAGIARRLAAIAEDVRRDLSLRTSLDPPRHVHVVLVDQSDVANGWSTPVPYDLIEIAATPAAPSSFLGHQDDWLRTVFAHEYAHLLHLDRVGGAMTGLRWLLGRHPSTFPNLFVPQWQIEGFATWAEGAASGLGRTRAADVRAVIDASSGAGGLPLDRAGGGLVAWPSGHTPYFFGGRFYQELAGRASEAAIGELARRTARRLPYFGGGAFRRVFGDSGANLWRQTFARAPSVGDQASKAPRRLTWEGFAVSGPRVIQAGREREDGAPAVYYSSRGPHRFPEIRTVGVGGGTSAPVASRYAGDTLSSDGRWIFFDQLEFDAAVALVSDLYAVDLESRRTLRLSHGQRLTDPDVDRRGSRLVAIKAAAGRKRPVILDLERGADGRPSLSSEPPATLGASGCDYASPRWSPDATRIAAVRQCPGSLPAIVVLDADGSGEFVVAPESGARDVTPAWLPDGRALIFASDRQDRRFKLFAVTVADLPGAPAREPAVVVDAPGGAIWPDVSPDGRAVVFTSLTADGYDVFACDGSEIGALAGRMAGPAAVRSEPPAARDAGMPQGPESGAGDGMENGPGYSPWRTLLPRAWWPSASRSGGRVDLGGSVGASDALGYHEYLVSASWRPSNERVDLSFGGAAVEWSAWYSYNRWTPSFFLSAKETIDTLRVGTADPGVTLTADERTREIFAGVVVPWRRVRIAQSWLAGADLETRRLPAAAGLADRNRHAVRAAWTLSSARTFGYSISPERGVRTSVTIERVLPALGADGRATAMTADARAYLPAFGRHDVVAVRAALGTSRGDPAVRRRFSLGRSALPASSFSFGGDALGLLRGLGEGRAANWSLAVVNIDYRFPLLRVERGVRTWPVFLRDVHGSVFVDAGSAGPTLGALPNAAHSVGAEISARLTLGYGWDVSLTAGVARVHDPSRVDSRDRTAAFVRTGYAF